MAKGKLKEKINGFLDKHPLLNKIVDNVLTFGKIKVSIDVVDKKGLVIFEYDFELSIDENLNLIKKSVFDMHQDYVADKPQFRIKK